MLRVFFIHWAVLIVAVIVAAALVEGIEYDGWQALLTVAAVLGLLNALVRPILVHLAFPLIFLTLGAFLLILNVIELWLAEVIVDLADSNAFQVDGFADLFLGAVIIGVVGWALGFLVKPLEG